MDAILRVGRRVGRTIYIQHGPEPDEHRDDLIGLVDTSDLAALIVEAVNGMVRRGEATISDHGGEQPWRLSTSPP